VYLLCKGAPESLRDICRPETLPYNLDGELHLLTRGGYRVLACSARKLEGPLTDWMVRAVVLTMVDQAHKTMSRCMMKRKGRS
jgi:magnesium-transporting ATPase (P-type)